MLIKVNRWLIDTSKWQFTLINLDQCWSILIIWLINVNWLVEAAINHRSTSINLKCWQCRGKNRENLSTATLNSFCFCKISCGSNQNFPHFHNSQYPFRKFRIIYGGHSELHLINQKTTQKWKIHVWREFLLGEFFLSSHSLLTWHYKLRVWIESSTNFPLYKA